MNVLKCNTSKTEKLGAQQIIEKDFLIFEESMEDYPTVFYQFHSISSLCDYYPEDKLIKLQKCPKGEAKTAVAGTMLTPGNLDLVLNTLKMNLDAQTRLMMLYYRK